MPRKNGQLHFLVESSFKARLEKEAKELRISVAELCRRKLDDSSPLFQIRLRLERIEKKILEN